MSIKYVDIGLNLFSRQYAGREEEVMAAADAAGVGVIITGSSERSSSQAVDYVAQHPGAYATVGVHPHAAKDCDGGTIERLRRMIVGASGIVAVGECGLDYDRMFSPRTTQLEVFEAQIALAEELDMPLFLHEREAAQDFTEVLQRHQAACQRAVVHCYTGDARTVERYLALGCHIGITGWVCDDRRNAALLEALRVIPMDRMMAETDGPYLKPRVKGLRDPNVPEYIVHVVQRIARELDMDEEALRQQLLENTRAFFGLDESVAA